MTHVTKNVLLWVCYEKKKLIEVSFVTISVKLHKYTCVPIIKTQYDKPKSVSLEVQKSLKTLRKAMSDQTFNV